MRNSNFTENGAFLVLSTWTPLYDSTPNLFLDLFLKVVERSKHVTENLGLPKLNLLSMFYMIELT